MSDDARDQSAAALGLGGDPLGLSHGRERGRAVGAVGGAALHEHGAFDPVPAADVGEQVGEAVRERSAGPQVMVRIDDAPLGIDDRLVHERTPLVGARPRRAHDRELYHARKPREQCGDDARLTSTILRMLNAGVTAPELDSVVDQDGNPVRLADLRGRWVLLWWYPMADTPG